MALFGLKRRLSKGVKILAFVVALSTACSKKSEQFVDLVEKQDRVAATEVVSGGGKEFDKVNVALNRIKDKTKTYETIFNLWKGNPTPPYRADSFMYYMFFADMLNDQLRVFREKFSGGKYTQDFSVELRVLEGVGLTGTAHKLRLDLVNLHIGMDEALALRIKESVNEIVARLNGGGALAQPESQHVRTVSDVLQKFKILELLREVASKASRAGYENTSEAANKAILALQAAMK